MDAIHEMIWFHGKFLGTDWTLWNVVGWLGNAVFTARFFVQWYASERQRAVVVPLAFWWLSLAGSWCLLAYATFGKHDAVIIAAQAFNWIPYLRNIILHHRHVASHLQCRVCTRLNPPDARFCMECGKGLPPPNR
jgi:lipid-A-disaccharide synthase-like uncharacterized protein